MTFNVTTPDVEGFRRSETQLSAMLARAVGSGHRNLCSAISKSAAKGCPRAHNFEPISHHERHARISA